MPSTPARALAALRDGRYRSHRADRPRRARLADGRTLEWPGPRELASVYLLPLLAETREIYRRPSGPDLLARPCGASEPPELCDAQVLADELLNRLRALPDLDGAGRPYEDVRILAHEGDASILDAYLAEVVSAARRLAPAWLPPAATSRPAAPPQSDSERRAASRARAATARAGVAEKWLTAWLADDAVPGQRVDPAALYQLADDDAFGDSDVVPGPRDFYAAADKILGPRHRSHGARFYLIPQPTTAQEAIVNHSAYDAVLERAAEILADRTETYQAQFRSGDTVGALSAQRELRSTGTDGAAVIPFPKAAARR